MRSVRDEILAGYGKADHDVKSDNTVVTDTDKSVERKITAALREKFPDVGIRGEEHGDSGDMDNYWLVDPIDGTENYVRGLPGITTIIALVEGGELTQSYIYDIVDDDLYWAVRGEGAFKDDTQINVVERELSRTLLTLSSNMPLRHPDVIRGLKDAGVKQMPILMGAGIKGCYVAGGKLDGILYLNHGGHEWDHRPIQLLACEAGAKFTELPLQVEGRWSYALTTPRIHDAVVKAVNQVLHD